MCSNRLLYASTIARGLGRGRGGWNLGKVLPKIGRRGKKKEQFDLPLQCQFVCQEKEAFGCLRNMRTLDTYWILLAIVPKSHGFAGLWSLFLTLLVIHSKRELNTDVRTASRMPLIQNQGFPPPPPLTFQHLSKYVLYHPKYTPDARWCEKDEKGMKENRSHAKALLLFLNCLWNTGEIWISWGVSVFGPPAVRGHTSFTSPYPARCLWSENTTKSKIWRQILVNLCVRCSMSPPTLSPRWYSPPCPSPRKNPDPNHSILSSRGTRCSKGKRIPWEKGVSKWDKDTWSNWFTGLAFTGLLVNSQVYSLQVQTWHKHRHRETKVHWVVFDPFHFLSFPQKQELRRVSGFIPKCIHTLREDSSQSSVPACLMLQYHLLHNSP